MAFWLAVCLILHRLIQASNADSSSFIAVVSYTTRTPGSSPSPALCTLPLLVRLCVLHRLAAALWADVMNIAMGIVILASHSCGWGSVKLILPHLSVSVSLNVLLTLMIVTRLVLHGRNVRATIGSPTGMSRLSKTIITMLIESSALYAVNSLLLIGLWAAGNPASGIFLPIISQNQVGFSSQPHAPDRLTNWTVGLVQVIAPLLIIQRVANRSALASNTTITEHIGRRELAGDRTPPALYPMGSADHYGKHGGGAGVHGVETTIDLRRDSEV